MDTFLLHGIIPLTATTPPDAPPHLLLARRDLVALVSRTETDFATGAPDAVVAMALRHHQILSAYAGAGPVLPLRFGAAFSTIEAIGSRLEALAETGRNALRSLDGLHEFTLRIVPVAASRPAPVRTGSGRDFLAKGLAARQSRESLATRRALLAQDLVEGLHPIAHRVERQPPHAERLFEVTALIHDHDMTAFRSLERALSDAAQHCAAELHCLGPWPCYSFDFSQEDPAHVA